MHVVITEISGHSIAMRDMLRNAEIMRYVLSLIRIFLDVIACSKNIFFVQSRQALITNGDK